jgi:pyruvate dehydrogenase E2 component (dihydrolipoamide acetyltransferase)
MIHLVTLPQMDANMLEATIGPWQAREGESIKRGKPLVDLITDKTTYEFESPKSGVLRKILAPENSVVPVGYVLALVGKPDDDLPEVESRNADLLEQHRQKVSEQAEPYPTTADSAPAKQDPRPGPGDPPSSATSERIRATPAAKRIAREHGIDLAAVQKAFPSDLINEATIQKYLETI